MLTVGHAPQADALYIRLSDKPYAFGEDIDHARRIDDPEERTPIGIDLLYVSHGVDLTELPEAEALARVLREHNIRQLA
ncbi:MAG: DUF2283 domain-containing protein [Chloroflexota bacterium]|nr:DUF2283 domain-containing protein [Chloroflexota bacterium]